jgi:predicted anti-sigma-YlaC factor YlaD
MKDKMNCSFCRERIDQYTEGRLGYEDKLSFESHLQTCPECRKILNLQVLTDRIIISEKKAEPGFYLSDKIMAKIGSLEKEKDHPLSRFFKPALATISVAAAIMAGIFIGSIPKRTSGMTAPIELVLMMDTEMESVNVFAAE